MKLHVVGNFYHTVFGGRTKPPWIILFLFDYSVDECVSIRTRESQERKRDNATEPDQDKERDPSIAVVPEPSHGGKEGYRLCSGKS